MARLPQPGGDKGSWGDILNDFLSQAHDTDGSLSADTVGVSQVEDQAISETKLAPAVQTKLNNAPSVADDSISTVKLQDDSVTTIKLADDAVTSGKIAPGAVTQSDVGLSNVDNTSDTDKPTSTATQAALDAKQPLATMLTKLTALAATLTEGQLIKWDATLGEPVAMNPVGNSLNAVATNTTGVATSASAPGAGLGTIVAIPGTAISVTNSSGRSVRLEMEATIQQNVAGTGTGWLLLVETTSGDTYRRYVLQPLPGVTTANLNQISLGLHSVNIGVVTTTRTFALRVVVAGVTGTPGMQVFNQPNYPTVLRAINE